MKFYFSKMKELFCRPYLFNRSDHGEHDRHISVVGCPQDGSQLGIEDFRTGKADTDGTEA